MRQLELQLQNQYPQYRRIWVQYCTYRKLRVVLTLFPQGNEPYTMVFGEPTDLSFESISNILQTNTLN